MNMCSFLEGLIISSNDNFCKFNCSYVDFWEQTLHSIFVLQVHQITKGIICALSIYYLKKSLMKFV